jgi:hypothetical protein
VGTGQATVHLFFFQFTRKSIGYTSPTAVYICLASSFLTCVLIPIVPHRHFQQFVSTRDCLYPTEKISAACTADLFLTWIGRVNLLSSCDSSPLPHVVYIYFSRWTAGRIYVDLNFGDCLIIESLDIANEQITCHIDFR